MVNIGGGFSSSRPTPQRVVAVPAVAVRAVCDWHFEEIEKEAERIQNWLGELETFLAEEEVFSAWQQEEGI